MFKRPCIQKILFRSSYAGTHFHLSFSGIKTFFLSQFISRFFFISFIILLFTSSWDTRKWVSKIRRSRNFRSSSSSHNLEIRTNPSFFHNDIWPHFCNKIVIYFAASCAIYCAVPCAVIRASSLLALRLCAVSCAANYIFICFLGNVLRCVLIYVGPYSSCTHLFLRSCCLFFVHRAASCLSSCGAVSAVSLFLIKDILNIWASKNRNRWPSEHRTFWTRTFWT